MKFLIEIQWQAKRIITINPWSWCELGIAAAQVLQDMSLHHRDRVLMRNSGNSSENTKRSLIHLSCCVFSYLACLMTSHHISRLVWFAPWLIFLSLVIDIDIRVALYPSFTFSLIFLLGDKSNKLEVTPQAGSWVCLVETRAKVWFINWSIGRRKNWWSVVGLMQTVIFATKFVVPWNPRKSRQLMLPLDPRNLAHITAIPVVSGSSDVF